MTDDVFTASGTFTPPAGVTSVDVLVVAGGGGGGSSSTTGGGGGGGGVVYQTGVSVTPGVGVTVTVGAGGTRANGTAGGQGGTSAFGAVTATGGGGGATPGTAGGAGGSGGGGAGGSSGSNPAGGAGTAGQGNNGGAGAGSSFTSQRSSGGGGGAGGTGTNGVAGSTGSGGNGGVGVNYSATFGTGVGASGWFGGGGGGGCGGSGGGGAAGTGGGGAKGGNNGAANTGGGGGGATSTAQASGTGGSGVVIVRYTTPPAGDTIVGGQAVETDTAQAGTTQVGVLVAGSQASETDAALAGSTITRALVAGGQALEVDAALPGTTKAGRLVTGGTATETDTALAGTVRVGVTLTGGRAVELDEALAGSASGVQVIGGDQANEVDTARPGSTTTTTTIGGGSAGETDVAMGGSTTAAGIVGGGVAGETDTAMPGIVEQLIIGGAAAETDTALAGTSSAGGDVVGGGVAIEFDLGQRGIVALSYYDTDIRTRGGGRRRGGSGEAYWEPPVAPVPDDLTVPADQAIAAAYDTAVAYLSVTMEKSDAKVETSIARKPAYATRIVIGGKDISYFRDAPTPEPRYQLVEPFMWAYAWVKIPQIIACFENLGQGALSWLRPHEEVLIQSVNSETGNVASTEFRGIVVGFDTSGPELVVEVGGAAIGRLEMNYKPLPLFEHTKDAGKRGWSMMNQNNLLLRPYLGPETGIPIARFGESTWLEFGRELLARTQTRSGNQWTIMPVLNHWEMHRKDRTTIHATCYFDDQTVQSLHRDTLDENNQTYATGVTPAGQRVRFGVYPGLQQGDAPPYPFHDGRSFGAGTTNEDTHTGEGVRLMLQRLQVTGFLNRRDRPGGFDADVTAAIRELQAKTDLSVTGTMNPATWENLYDLDETGTTLAFSRIEPAAQRSKVRKWNIKADGSIVGINPGWDPTVLPNGKMVDFGAGFTRQQMEEFAEADLADREANWVGQVTFNTGALIHGEHTFGDPITEDDVMRAKNLVPGMNLWAPLWDGGTLFHVSTIDVDENGVVTASIDTRARDSVELAEVIHRRREARRDPARMFLRRHRASGQVKDAISGFDEVGGILGNDIVIPGNQWTVFELIAGQQGIVRRLLLQTVPHAEFVCAVFGRKINPERLERLVPTPLTAGMAKAWRTDSVRKQLDDVSVLLYAAGQNNDPCGYSPGSKQDEDPELTGKWDDTAGFEYHTFFEPVLYVAIYADRDTTIEAGRVAWEQLGSWA